MDDPTPEDNSPSGLQIFFHRLGMKYQSFLDKLTPHTIPRWVFTLFFFGAYIIRVYLLQGFHIISYGLGIYVLNLFIGFLTPKIDPAMARYTDEEPTLPTSRHDEFRPFVRRLPEFKFWHSFTKAVLIAIFLTCFKAFDVPVFWPILVMYFILLFFLTMKQQIKHMIKYRYLPFTYGKPHHKGTKEETGKVVVS